MATETRLLTDYLANPGADDSALSSATTALHVGGFRQVADLSARDAIPTARRTAGMVVYDISTGREYQLVGGIANGNWVDVTSAGIVNALIFG